jgi:hypothetical protein
MFFAFNIVRLWFTFLPQMEVAGRETAQLISGEGASVQIINTDMIPEVRMFFLMSLITFGILDGVFSFMLGKGKPVYKNRAIIMPLFLINTFGRIMSVIIISTIPITVIVGSNPRLMMMILYFSAVILATLSLVIILIFLTKVYTPSKRTATKIMVGRSEESIP